MAHSHSGYDRIDQIRMEFGILESLAALMLNIPREEVTIPLVQRLIADLGNRMMWINEADLARIEGIDAATLLALAMAKRTP